MRRRTMRGAPATLTGIHEGRVTPDGAHSAGTMPDRHPPE